MKINRYYRYLLTAAAGLALASSASAGFVNGGFELGNFTGWTVQTGNYNGGGNSGLVFGGGNGTASVIGAVADPFSPFDTPFNDNFMARLNTVNSGGAGAARISQTATMLAGETNVFINWGAVLNDPGHDPSENPFFDIQVYKNAVLFGSEFNIAGAGWTPSGGGNSFKSGQFSVGGLVPGDQVQVVMTVADCALGGHAGWAYLDGIGTTSQPPPPGVPDGGATITLLGVALSGLAAVRRKLKLA